MSSETTIETYLAHMRPIAEGMAAKRKTHHPYLGFDDLVQEGLTAAYRLWEKNAHRLPYDDLCKIGHVAMFRQMQDQRQRACSYGEGTVLWADLDQSEGHRDVAVLESVFLALGLQEVEAMLSEPARDVLKELLAPSTKMLRAVKRLWKYRRSGLKLCYLETRALASALRTSVPAVRMLLKEVRQSVAHIFLNAQPGGNRYTIIGEERRPKMGNKKEMVPDPVALGDLGMQPDPTQPELTPEPPAPKAKSRAAKTQAAAPKKVPKKAPKKEGGAKVKTAAPRDGKPKVKKAAHAVRHPESKSGNYRAPKTLILEMFSKGATVEKVVTAVEKEFPDTVKMKSAEPRTLRILRWATEEGGYKKAESKGGVITLTGGSSSKPPARKK